MRLEILQETLNEGLGIVSRFVSLRPQLPILSNILLATEEGKLLLSATNLELGVNLWLGAKIEKEGKIALPAREITEFVSYLSGGKLILEKEEKQDRLTISSPQAKGSFVGMKADEFPRVPRLEKEKSFTLPLEGLREAVSQVSFAAAEDETRPVLGGVYWQFKDNQYQMVATDGYRLSLKKVPFPKKEKKEKMVFLVPARSLNEMVRLSKGDEVKVSLSEDENQVVFGFPQLEVSSRLLEGEFPEYEKIIPQESKTQVVVSREDFIQAVKIASVFAREAANIIVFQIDKKEVVLTVEAPQVGENRTSLPAQTEGEPLKIAFNYRFLLDFLGAVPPEEKELVWQLNTPLSPAVFKLKGDESWLHIIMPVRLEEDLGKD